MDPDTQWSYGLHAPTYVALNSCDETASTVKFAMSSLVDLQWAMVCLVLLLLLDQPHLALGPGPGASPIASHSCACEDKLPGPTLLDGLACTLRDLGSNAPSSCDQVIKSCQAVPCTSTFLPFELSVSSVLFNVPVHCQRILDRHPVAKPNHIVKTWATDKVQRARRSSTRAGRIRLRTHVCYC
jgi:hypothetical protein